MSACDEARAELDALRRTILDWNRRIWAQGVALEVVLPILDEMEAALRQDGAP